MPFLHNTGDWFMLEPDTYRKIDLETPDWPIDIDFDSVNVYAAPFGGPIAVVRDAGLIVPSKAGIKPVIRILDTAGAELGKIQWNHGKLITMGWSDSEELICVQDDATIAVYTIFGKLKDSYSMCDEARHTKIVDAKVFQSYSGTGVAVLTTNGRIFLKTSTAKDYRARQLPEIPKSISQCTCWEIVTEGRNSYCLLGRDQEVIKLVPGESVGTITRSFFDKPIDRILLMSVSYNMQNLALYSNNGILWLGSVDMKKKLCEFDTGRRDVPKQIEWIVSTDNKADAVVIAYNSFLLVVNCKGDKNLFSYDPAIFLVAEMDGVRIMTQSAHELMQMLPKCVHNIFAINSQEPSSYLLEAYRKFEEKSHKSAEYLGVYRDQMDLAVDECIEAAGHEFSPETQKILLKTAYFGKSFIAGHNPDEYMRMLRMLRVLNALRHPRLAMPITYKQFEHLKPQVILGRLVFRKHYAMAIQVAKHLRIPESWILEHWAYHKVLNDKNDMEVARKITEKFKHPSVTGISFCNIAEKAYEAGRNELAIKLLELETRAYLQVPLLLKLGQHHRAIQSATQSGDTELVTQVLLEVKKKMLTNFHIIIREFPMALNMYKKVMAATNPSGLYEFYKTEDNHKIFAEYNLRNAIETNSVESNLTFIANTYALRPYGQVEAELCTDTAKMMKLQKALTKKYESLHVTFQGLSIHDTVLELLRLGDLKEAEKIKNDFKIPDRRFALLRIRILAEKQKWEELEKYGKTKKGPIDAFVEACLQKNNLPEAKKYMMKCRDDRKLYWLMRAGLYEEAAECALQQRDLNTLYAIQKKATLTRNHILLSQINSCLAMLSSKK